MKNKMLMINNYSEAIKYIEEKSKLGSVPGLDNITELLKRLGNPQEGLRCLHIAGTNGKGSVLSFVQTALVKSGYKVGRYVSPTVFEYLERFQLSGDGKIFYMPETDFVRILSRVSEAVQTMENDGLNSPTAFEIETAAAYLYFAEEEVDFALIECGMGGRLDATNVLSKPYLTVISSISLDHMQFLGETLTEIAGEKAGIIKENGICISAPQEEEVMSVLEEACAEKNARLIFADDKKIKCLRMDAFGTELGYKGEKYELGMVGEYQLINAALAVEVLEYIKKNEAGNEIDIKNGLASTVWPGRFTVKNKNPLVIVDGAHNEAAWRMLSETLKKHFAGMNFVFITGVLKDKEYDKLAAILSPLMSHAIAITPDNPRGLRKEALQDILIKNGVDCETADSAEEAYKRAYAWAAADDNDKCGIVVCGSLSFLSEYL